MNIRYVVLLLLVSFSAFAQNNAIKITPEKPQIGDKVTISFKDDAVQTAPTLVFSYSNFFEMPNQLLLEKKADGWETSFVVPRYAKYASFYIKQGNRIFRPDESNHYELIFYKNGKPVFDTYLYKSYSLTAQMGKSDAVKRRADELIAQELQLHPDNYAARLKQLANLMAANKADSKKYLDTALTIIEAKLNENPTDMGNVNQVTMGYLIVGENARLDTLRKRLLKAYPRSEVAFEFLYEQAYQTKNEAERIKKMEQLMHYQTDGESSTQSGIHQHLFAYYAKQKNEKKALMHARAVAGIKNPWLPKELKELAETLTQNNLALDTAKFYAEKALSMVHDYPFGVIRYFPEYGYIPGYVAQKDRLVAEQKGEILSIIGTIAVRQQKFKLAEQTLKAAEQLSTNKTVYQNLAYLYEKTNRPQLAFEAYRKIVLQLPVDSAMLAKLKQSYIAYNGSIKGFDQQLSSVKEEWEKINLPILRATKLDVQAPVFAEVFDMEGKLVDPSTFKNKIIVLDFWATWCVPCIEGFPYMQRVYNRYQNSPDVVFMIMNSGSKNTLQDAVAWAKANRFTFPIYYNDRKLATAFNVTTIPSTFVIDKNGKIQYKSVGFEGPMMEAKLMLEIKDLLTQ